VGSPLRQPEITAKIAQATLLGGAVGLRVNGPDDVAAVRAITDVPIIGLFKIPGERRNIITPSVDLAASLVAAGADVVAVDATSEALGPDFGLIEAIIHELAVPVMADCSTQAEARRAMDAGAAILATTLSGYTPDSQSSPSMPDIALVAAVAQLGLPVIAEGRYRSPDQVADAFAAGAFAVVVGTAITDPMTTTRFFTAVTPRGNQ